MKKHSNIALLLLFLLPACKVLAQGLTKEQAEEARKEVVAQWMEEARKQTDYILTDGVITRGGKTMKLCCLQYGEQPKDGFSLYISLHGGGNTASSVNDSQWKNQWGLYEPKNAVYVCPRAPYDDWDMHFKPDLDGFYHEIIRFAVSHLNVNPNKVYVMGYSAGGDGVWRLAPRMADTWAAASMMAGHPGDVNLLNLRNTPFMVWCGALDAAYERNKRCAERIAELDSLQRASGNGYVHEGHIVEGKPHWMDRVDTVAVSWMAKHLRNPFPTDIVWHQEEVLKSSFYWIAVPEEEMERGKEVRLSVKGNNIRIEHCDYTHLTLGLSDELLNLDKPVTVYLNGRKVMKKKVQRSREILEKWIARKGDTAFACAAELELNF